MSFGFRPDGTDSAADVNMELIQDADDGDFETNEDNEDDENGDNDYGGGEEDGDMVQIDETEIDVLGVDAEEGDLGRKTGTFRKRDPKGKFLPNSATNWVGRATKVSHQKPNSARGGRGKRGGRGGRGGHAPNHKGAPVKRETEVKKEPKVKAETGVKSEKKVKKEPGSKPPSSSSTAFFKRRPRAKRSDYNETIASHRKKATKRSMKERAKSARSFYRKYRNRMANAHLDHRKREVKQADKIAGEQHAEWIRNGGSKWNPKEQGVQTKAFKEGFKEARRKHDAKLSAPGNGKRETAFDNVYWSSTTPIPVDSRVPNDDSGLAAAMDPIEMAMHDVSLLRPPSKLYKVDAGYAGAYDAGMRKDPDERYEIDPGYTFAYDIVREHYDEEEKQNKELLLLSKPEGVMQQKPYRDDTIYPAKPEAPFGAAPRNSAHAMAMEMGMASHPAKAPRVAETAQKKLGAPTKVLIISTVIPNATEPSKCYGTSVTTTEPPIFTPSIYPSLALPEKESSPQEVTKYAMPSEDELFIFNDAGNDILVNGSDDSSYNYPSVIALLQEEDKEEEEERKRANNNNNNSEGGSIANDNTVGSGNVEIPPPHLAEVISISPGGSESGQQNNSSIQIVEEEEEEEEEAGGNDETIIEGAMKAKTRRKEKNTEKQSTSGGIGKEKGRKRKEKERQDKKERENSVEHKSSHPTKSVGKNKTHTKTHQSVKREEEKIESSHHRQHHTKRSAIKPSAEEKRVSAKNANFAHAEGAIGIKVVGIDVSDDIRDEENATIGGGNDEDESSSESNEEIVESGDKERSSSDSSGESGSEADEDVTDEVAAQPEPAPIMAKPLGNKNIAVKEKPLAQPGLKVNQIEKPMAQKVGEVAKEVSTQGMASVGQIVLGMTPAKTPTSANIHERFDAGKGKGSMTAGEHLVTHLRAFTVRFSINKPGEKGNTADYVLLSNFFRSRRDKTPMPASAVMKSEARPFADISDLSPNIGVMSVEVYEYDSTYPEAIYLRESGITWDETMEEERRMDLVGGSKAFKVERVIPESFVSVAGATEPEKMRFAFKFEANDKRRGPFSIFPATGRQFLASFDTARRRYLDLMDGVPHAVDGPATDVVKKGSNIAYLLAQVPEPEVENPHTQPAVSPYMLVPAKVVDRAVQRELLKETKAMDGNSIKLTLYDSNAQRLGKGELDPEAPSGTLTVTFIVTYFMISADPPPGTKTRAAANIEKDLKCPHK